MEKYFLKDRRCRTVPGKPATTLTFSVFFLLIANAVNAQIRTDTVRHDSTNFRIAYERRISHLSDGKDKIDTIKLWYESSSTAKKIDFPYLDTILRDSADCRIAYQRRIFKDGHIDTLKKWSEFKTSIIYSGVPTAQHHFYIKVAKSPGLRSANRPANDNKKLFIPLKNDLSPNYTDKQEPKTTRQSLPDCPCSPKTRNQPHAKTLNYIYLAANLAAMAGFLELAFLLTYGYAKIMIYTKRPISKLIIRDTKGELLNFNLDDENMSGLIDALTFLTDKGTLYYEERKQE